MSRKLPSESRRPRRAREREHQRAARATGFRSASIVTRIAVAASVALSIAFSAIAAVAFPGRASRQSADGKAANAATSSTGPVVALPPANAGSGGVPAPPLQAPVSAPGSGQVGSGGS
jgi:hypothetical protein